MKKFRFGVKSRRKLNTCDPRLVKVAERALELSPVDFTIVWGWRNKEQQNAMVASRVSKKRWPHSKHNAHKKRKNDIVPNSKALDFAPWVGNTIPWDDTHVFAVIAGCFFAAAKELKINIRYGGDWDMDGSTKDQTLMDWGHVELLR